jgi:uncharacterized protein YcgI (DUF1989 family)
MALVTEDITISEAQGWTAIVLTGTVIHITEVRGNKMLYRFGISSLSKGTEIGTGESFTVDETIYVKPSNINLGPVSITVTKD